MPVLTSPACIVTVDCPLIPFPDTPAGCICDTATGGVNDLYFVPCDQTMSEVNVVDNDWWTTVAALPNFGRIGIGLGSISKKSDKKERVGSCRTEQILSMTWALKYQIKCFDKTSAQTTAAQMTALITKFNKWLLVARMCDGDETVIPIGRFTTSDFNWTVPDNFEEYQVAELELSWNELGMPKTYTVAGLDVVLPKNS